MCPGKCLVRGRINNFLVMSPLDIIALCVPFMCTMNVLICFPQSLVKLRILHCLCVHVFDISK